MTVLELQEPPRREALRRRLLPFTGLIPVLLMVPVLAFNLYGLAIVLSLVSGAGVIAYHLSRGQGVTSLDLILLGFGLLNAILYFGFDNAVLLDHIDAVIYTVLAAPAAWSLVRGPAWTTQFTKRTVAACPPTRCPLPAARPTAAASGRPRPRCGSRTSCCSSGASDCARGRARGPRSDHRRTRRGARARRRG